MPTIFCSLKLSKLLGVSREQTIMRDVGDYSDYWNAHLFYLSKRKCIIFINKSSLYSFVILDFIKKDIDPFPKFFIENFLRQLKSDNILTLKYKEFVENVYQNIVLMPTDNDKKIIGSMNDCIYQIGVYADMNSGIEYLDSNFIGQRLNDTPRGSINYFFPFEAMNEIIKNHT